MLGWVITCHDDRAQEILDALEKKHGALLQCRAVNFWRGLSSNMLSRMMCDALHEADSGEGVIFLTDIAGAPPYRVASLLSHKHSRCEVISGVTLPLIEQMMACRETMTSSVTDIAGAPPYRVASLLSHKHSRCEVISGVTLPLIEQMMACRETMTSSEFRERIVELGGPPVAK